MTPLRGLTVSPAEGGGPHKCWKVTSRAAQRHRWARAGSWTQTSALRGAAATGKSSEMSRPEQRHTGSGAWLGSCCALTGGLGQAVTLPGGTRASELGTTPFMEGRGPAALSSRSGPATAAASTGTTCAMSLEAVISPASPRCSRADAGSSAPPAPDFPLLPSRLCLPSQRPSVPCHHERGRQKGWSRCQGGV